MGESANAVYELEEYPVAQSVQNAQILNVNSRLALDVTDDGTSATQRAPDPKRESQRWNITLVNEHDSRYLIENVQRGQVLAPVGDWEAAFQPRGGPRQEWRLASLGGDVHQIENPYSSPSRVLEIFSASTDEGATVSQYPNHDGANQRWELTAATSTPSLPGLPEYIQAGGTGWAWGHDANGMLGNGQTIADQPTPVEVSFPRRVAGKAVAVAAFWRHSLAVLENGSVWAWGHGGAGRLGNCQTGDQWAPVEISFPRSVTAKAIAVAAGAHHSLVVLDDGHVWAWGNGANGRLGNGQTGDQWTPVEVLISRSVTAKAIAVAAGEHHSLVVLDDGSVWAWGHGGAGRLGNGQTADQWTPVGVLIPRSATAKALAVAAGWTHSLAALDDGSVWA
ncbi:MAG: RICIN domain-containing protein, partial [Egibacteraceae bacterium]